MTIIIKPARTFVIFHGNNLFLRDLTLSDIKPVSITNGVHTNNNISANRKIERNSNTTG